MQIDFLISSLRRWVVKVIPLCGMFCLRWSAGFSSLLRPREMSNRDDEEAVGCICDTGKGIVPSSESSENSECTSCTDASFIGVFAGRLKISDAQQEECQIQREEEEEERHGGFERAE